MIPDLFNYKVSALNPVLKLIVPLIFLWGTYYLYRARSQYEGELGKVVRRLFIAGVVGTLACFFRYGADLWFSSLKWGESLFFLAFGIANVYAAWPLLTFLRDVEPAPKAEPKAGSKTASTGV